MRRDHLDAVPSQLCIQRIAVVGAIADQVFGLGFDHEQAIFIASTAPAAAAFSRIDIFAHESRVRRRIAAAVLAHPTTAV